MGRSGLRPQSIELLKAIGSHLIVLHHLAFYGPMAHHAHSLAPGLFDWLDAHGRLAVQAFLVVGGFLAARSLAPYRRGAAIDPLGAVLRRLPRIWLPFVASIGLALSAAAIASRWMTHDAIPDAPGPLQLLANFFLLQDVLGVDALSAGYWYVAIDLQLFATLAALLWFASRIGDPRGASWRIPAAVTLAVVASLFHFNRDASWDAWAPYFIGSYGLGALAWWASEPGLAGRKRLALVAALVLPALLAVAVDFRIRIALALVVALLLAELRASGRQLPGAALPGVAAAARISYSLFLVHFPVCLVVNAAFERFLPHQPVVQLLGVLIAWALSVLAAGVFHRCVEGPVLAATRDARPGSPTPAGSVAS